MDPASEPADETRLSASIATIVRMKYLTDYQNPNDTLYNLVPIALWSEMECTLGILAGSLAVMRPLLRFLPAALAAPFTARSPSHALHDMCPHDSSSKPKKGSKPKSKKRQDSPDMENITYMGHSFHVKAGREAGEDREGEMDDAGSQRRMLSEGSGEALEIVKETRYEVRSERDGQGREWGDWRPNA